jgi:tRNA ligase
MNRHTAPPYRLTLKSNGCLILISALSPSHLLVASKHSLGTTIEEPVKKVDKEVDIVDDLAQLSLDGGAERPQSRPEDDQPTRCPAQTSVMTDVPIDTNLLVDLMEQKGNQTTASQEVNASKPKEKSKNQTKKDAKARKKAQMKEEDQAGRSLAISAVGVNIDPEREAEAHAEIGRQWVRRTLRTTGKTEADLARKLWDGNLTAVLEVRTTFL